MAFELFTNRSMKSNMCKDLLVTVSKSKTIYCHQRVLDEVIRENDYADLFYDAGFDRIGILFRRDASMASYKVHKNATGAQIVAVSFFNYYHVKLTETKKYKAFVSNEDGVKGLLVIAMQEPTKGTTEASPARRNANGMATINGVKLQGAI